MVHRPVTACGFLATALLTLTASPAVGVPWIPFADSQSASVCGVVNAANIELVVLAETGELASITGVDVVFLDTFVDSDGLVFFEGAPAGFLDFAEDGDGFRTLWWFVRTDDVANVNTFTGEPTETALSALDFIDVPCDACPSWDVPAECVDSDGDGVEDAADDCAATRIEEVADADGCSCSQLDDDLDAVDNCDDLCPGTAFDVLVAFDGCPVVDGSGGPAVVVSFCGGFGAPSLIMMLNGLLFFRMVHTGPRRG